MTPPRLRCWSALVLAHALLVAFPGGAAAQRGGDDLDLDFDPTPAKAKPAKPAPKPAKSAPAPAKRGTLIVTSPVAGAKILVDGNPAGTTPAMPIEVSSGSHKLKVVKPGAISFEKTVVVAAGETVRVTAAAIAASDDGLDLDFDLPAAPQAKAGQSGDDLDLDLLDTPPAKPTAPPAKATAFVATAAPSSPKPAAVEPPSAKPVAKPPATKPPAVVAQAKTPAPTTGFVADPIAKAVVEEEEEEEYDPTPFYKKKWVWATAAALAVAGAVVPVALGKTGGYVEQRNPDTICRDCLVVMNR